MTEAYQAAYQQMSSLRDAVASWSNLSNLSVSSITQLLEPLRAAQDFVVDHPVYARRLAADIAQTVAILSSSGNLDLSYFRPILERRTWENMVSDAVQGRARVLYGAEEQTELPEVNPTQLACMDFASRAPYIAGIIRQDALLGGQAGRSLAEWIPGLGSWAPVRWGAGAIGAIAEVRAQQAAVDRISRQAEVGANAVLAAMDAFPNGGYAGAVQAGGLYLARREALKQLGDIVRGRAEGKTIGQALFDFFAPDAAAAPGEEVVKAGVAAGTGTAAGVAAAGALLFFTGGTAAPLLAAVVGVGVGGGAAAATKKVTDVVRDRFKSKPRLDQEKQAETSRRLQKAYDNMRKQNEDCPAISEEEFKQIHTKDKLADIVDGKVKEVVEHEDRDFMQKQNLPQDPDGKSAWTLEAFTALLEKLKEVNPQATAHV